MRARHRAPPSQGVGRPLRTRSASPTRDRSGRILKRSALMRKATARLDNPHMSRSTILDPVLSKLDPRVEPIRGILRGERPLGDTGDNCERKAGGAAIPRTFQQQVLEEQARGQGKGHSRQLRSPLGAPDAPETHRWCGLWSRQPRVEPRKQSPSSRLGTDLQHGSRESACSWRASRVPNLLICRYFMPETGLEPVTFGL